MANDKSLADELLKLHQLKEKGIITDAEFNEQKAALLARANEKPPARPETIRTATDRQFVGRPLGITVVSAFTLFLAVNGFVIALYGAIHGLPLGAIFGCIWAALFSLCAYGAWARKRWGRNLNYGVFLFLLMISILALLGVIIASLSGAGTEEKYGQSGLVGALIFELALATLSITILWYLSRDVARKYFNVTKSGNLLALAILGAIMLVVVVLLAIGGYFWFSSHIGNHEPAPTTNESSNVQKPDDDFEVSTQHDEFKGDVATATKQFVSDDGTAAQVNLTCTPPANAESNKQNDIQNRYEALSNVMVGGIIGATLGARTGCPPRRKCAATMEVVLHSSGNAVSFVAVAPTSDSTSRWVVYQTKDESSGKIEKYAEQLEVEGGSHYRNAVIVQFPTLGMPGTKEIYQFQAQGHADPVDISIDYSQPNLAQFISQCNQQAGMGAEEEAPTSPPSDQTGNQLEAPPSTAPDELPNQPEQPNVEATPESSATSGTQTPPTSYAAGDIVRAFYEALGRGDGITAASFVVPEKRESGPLSADELKTYYSALQTPLSIKDVSAIGNNQYKVNYSYVRNNGAACDGTSTVTTVERDGGLLIDRIEAPNGC